MHVRRLQMTSENVGVECSHVCGRPSVQLSSVHSLSYILFTRSSWLNELLYVSWTSQLDVCLMIASCGLCLMHASYLLDVCSIVLTGYYSLTLTVKYRASHSYASLAVGTRGPWRAWPDKAWTSTSNVYIIYWRFSVTVWWPITLMFWSRNWHARNTCHAKLKLL